MIQENLAATHQAERRPSRIWKAVKVLFAGIGLTCFAALVFVIALAVSAPATSVRELVTLPPQITEVSGRLWSGRATLLGGYTLRWQGNAGQLLRGKLRMDVSLQGHDTQLMGQVWMTPTSVGANDVSGRAGPGLLPLFPNFLVKSCTSRAIVDVALLRVGRDSAAADGVILVDAGTCVDQFGGDNTVPKLQLDLLTQGRDAVGQLTDRDGSLAQFTITGDRRVIARIEPEGAVLVPGLPTSGPIIVEYPF